MNTSASSSAFYAEPISSFLAQNSTYILGELSRPGIFSITPAQSSAWEDEILLLKEALQGIDGFLCLEFDVPRIGSRIDAVVLSGGCIFVLEFKVGESSFHRDVINQVWDYALDLKNFHRASHPEGILSRVEDGRRSGSIRNSGTCSCRSGRHRPVRQQLLLFLWREAVKPRNESLSGRCRVNHAGMVSAIFPL